MKKYFILAIILVLAIVFARASKTIPLPEECKLYEGSQICTEQYIPVCVVTESGEKTFSNLCKACIEASETKVIEVRDGEC